MSTHFVGIFKCCWILLNFDVIETAIPRISELVWWKCTRGTISPAVWILGPKTASCSLLDELMFLQILIVIINDFLSLQLHQCERFVELTVLICLAIVLDLSLLLCNCLLNFSRILLITRGFKLINQNEIWFYVCLALLDCCIYHLLFRFKCFAKLLGNMCLHQLYILFAWRLWFELDRRWWSTNRMLLFKIIQFINSK